MEKNNRIWRSTHEKAFGMTSRNQKAWAQVNTTESWHLHETTVHSWLPFHFSLPFPQCPAERDFGECSVPHCQTVEQGLNVWRSRYWEGLASYNNFATITLQSNSRGKWGSDQARQMKLRSHNQRRVSEPGMLRTGEAWAGAPSCPWQAEKPFLFSKYSNYCTISWVVEMPFWEYLLTCAKNLTLTF